VPALRSGARRWIAAGALLLSAVFGRPPGADAATTLFNVHDGAVVQVIGRSASISIRTWSRNAVQFEWPDGEAFVPSQGVHATSPSVLIPTVNVEEQSSPDSVTLATLLPEDFPLPKVAPGLHDVVRVAEVAEPAQAGKPPPPGHLTVTIPESTGLVNIRSGRGAVTLRDYHGTTIAAVGRGRVVFINVSGDAFVQPLNGHFYARNSTFDRLRIRSNRADQVFDACRVKQIEATTLTGNIIFDNGVFDPGLARFESDRGSIALGVNGGAQLGTHTDDGRVLTALPAAPSMPPLMGGQESSGFQFIGNGGPLVNVSSVHGNLFLYDGSLTNRRPGELAPAWQPMYDLLLSNRAVNRRRSTGAPVPRAVLPQRRPAR
jgi:hypothetical protein